jgi:ELWxxDGT repeat protein
MAPTAGVDSIAPLGTDVLFAGTDLGIGAGATPQQLWRLSAGGTATQLSDDPDFQYGPSGLTNWEGAVWFSGEEALWRSDGTPAGTGPIGEPEYAHGFTPGATHLFFVANGLWRVDSGTAAALPVAAALGLSPGRLVLTADAAGHDRLYFPAADAAGGNELWVSDGSDGGTQRVVDLLPGTGSGMSTFLEPGGFEEERLVATLGPLGIFAGDDGVHGDELWLTDGTPGNATLLELRPGAAGSEPRDLTTVGDRVYFVADDGVHGREPWVTDGTIAGTHMVADVRPGPESSVPKELTGWMDRLVFAADDGLHGMELWRAAADGTSAELVTDVRPGVEPSSPQGLTTAGERLYFFADDGTSGLEPWVWSAAAEMFQDGFETGNAARWSHVTPP